VDDLNLYIYVGNNPLKYRNLTGHVKIYSNRHLPYNEIDILSPIEGTYVAFLLHLGLVFASDKGSATIRVAVFVAEGLGFVVQL
jgi:hypothetical protein